MLNYRNKKAFILTIILSISSFSIIKSFDINQQFLLDFSDFLNHGEINTTIKQLCMDQITSDLTKRNDVYFLNYSGHSFSELGNPYACRKDKFLYYFLTITKILPELSDRFDKQLDIFFGVHKENYGFCIHSKCENATITFFDNQTNQKFYNYVRTEYEYSNIELSTFSLDEKYSKSFIILGSIVLIYIFIMIILRISSIVSGKGNDEDANMGTLKIEDNFNEVGQLFKTKKDNKKSRKEIDDNSFNFEGESGIQEEQKESSDDEEEINANNNKNEAQVKSEPPLNNGKPELKKNNNNISDNDDDDDDDDEGESYVSENSLFERYNNDVSDIYNLEKFISPVEGGNAQKVQTQTVKQTPKQNQIRFGQNNLLSRNLFSSICFSLNENVFPNMSIKTIFTFQNEMFNSNNVKVLTGMRAMILLMMTLFKTFENFYKQPSIGKGTSMFINSLNFCFIKFSSCSYHCFVFLDGINFAFRYMMYTKKNKTAKSVLKLYIKMIMPKILCFFIIFYFVYFIGNDISILYKKTAIFHQIYSEVHNNYHCLYNPIYFIPGALSYFSSFQTERCFPFTYLLINEFICITVMFILLTLLRFFKKPIIDYIVSLVVIFSILISFGTFLLFDKKHLQYKAYVLELIMGENVSIRFPHLMFNIFFIGMLSGLAYYYYLLSMRETGAFIQEKYLPFNYCISIITFFVGKQKLGKIFVNILSIILILLFLFLFHIIKFVTLDNKHEMLLKFNGMLKGVYCYEKVLIVLMFAILGTGLMIEDDQFAIKRFFANKIFFWIERIAFMYVILLDYGSLFTYSLFDRNGIEWDYLFIWFLTSFEMLIMLILAVLFTVWVELPFKYLFKKIIGKGEIEVKKY